MARIFMVAVMLAIVGCSGSEQGTRQASKSDKVGQADGDDAALAKRIIGKWEMANGWDYVIEFTRDGTMSVKNKAGERQVRLPGDKDLPYAFISETEVKSEIAPRGEFSKEEFFLFSVSMEGDKLTIRGKEGGQTIILSPDGVKELAFPGSATNPLELVRLK